MGAVSSWGADYRSQAEPSHQLFTLGPFVLILLWRNLKACYPRPQPSAKPPDPKTEQFPNSLLKEFCSLQKHSLVMLPSSFPDLSPALQLLPQAAVCWALCPLLLDSPIHNHDFAAHLGLMTHSLSLVLTPETQRSYLQGLSSTHTGSII